MATPSNFVKKLVRIYVRVHPKGIEYSWDTRNDKQADWHYIGTIQMPIRKDPKRTIFPALSMGLTKQLQKEGTNGTQL